jgi:hypothetical protein
MALINTEAFKVAAGYAKAIASLNDIKELSPLVFFGGCLSSLSETLWFLSRSRRGRSSVRHPEK